MNLKNPTNCPPTAYVEELDAMSNGSDTEYHPENEVQSGDECESVPIVTKQPKNFIVSEEALLINFSKYVIYVGRLYLIRVRLLKVAR